MSCGCPDKYTYNNSTGLCELIQFLPAEFNTAASLPYNVCTNVSYMRLGTVYYRTIVPSQFPLIGLNTISPSFQDNLGNVISPIDHFIDGFLWISRGYKDSGRLNQAGIGLLPPSNDWQGYSRCLTIEDGDIISVALSASKAFRLYVDDELAIQYTPLYPVSASDYLHIFPIALEQGDHNLRFEGLSEVTDKLCFDSDGSKVRCTSDNASSVQGGCIGAFVCEIFMNVTAQDLYSAANQDELNQYYAKHLKNGVFESISTLFLQGSPTDTGKNGNYKCADGYLTNCIEGAFYCRSVITSAYGSCCFNLINCVTAEVIKTNTNLNDYLGKIIKINEHSGCYLININDDQNCSGSTAVTVSSSYDTCNDCATIYYRLTDCIGIAGPLYTTTDLSEHVGKVIKITGYNVCWIVTIDVLNGLEIVPTIVESFENCEQCL